jgi:two-component system sensor histidine kinase KdpD
MLARHRVQVELAPNLPMLDLDGVLLDQVLFNLLDNASKYAPVMSTISIRARQINDSVIVQVTDEGPGIPSDDLERIFDKFYRANGGDRQRAGTGLGLAICRGFVEALGGSIVAGNRADCSGAIFTITLPVKGASSTARVTEAVDDG